MTPLPGVFGRGEIVAWRLDDARFAASWDSGEGAFQYGGRWNRPGMRAVYCALDEATAILEVAVHKGFSALDKVPHTLTALTLLDPSSILVVPPEDVPDQAWLAPGIPSDAQQRFGDGLLARKPFALIPSAVSRHSWNLVFDSRAAAGLYAQRSQELFVLDPRLHR